MSVIELRTLGALDLRAADGRELHSLLAQTKRIALLAYLCIAEPRGYHRRDTLLGLFWPDSDQEHARTSLRKSLHILRRALGEDTILSRGDEEIAIDRARISCDVVVFDDFVRSKRYQEALELYRGDLLTGFFIEDAPEFEQWIQAERNRLRLAAARAAYGAADSLEKTGDFVGAASLAQRSLDLASTDERTLRRLMELHVKAGDPSAAIASYEAFSRRIAADYQTQPSAETRSLLERIRSAREKSTRVTDLKPIDDGEREEQATTSSSSSGESVRPEKRGLRRERTLFVGAGITVLISTVLGWGMMRTPPSKQVLRYPLVIDSVEALAAAIPWTGRIAISPDGSRLAYVGGSGQQLLIRNRNELHAKPISGSDGASTPFFSPDGRRVGLLREQGIQIKSDDSESLITIPSPLTGVAGASWGADGFIYTDGFREAPLARVEAKPGAVATWFTTLDSAAGEIDHTWPEVLPNGKGVLLTVTLNGKGNASGQSSFAIAVAEIPNGKHRIIVDYAAHPRYAEPGRLLYISPDGALMVVPFDQNSMKVTGEASEVIRGIRLSRFGAADLAVSATGTLVYSVGMEQNLEELVWMGRDGVARPVDANWQGLFFGPSLSPDGKSIAISRSLDLHTADIWIKQLDRGSTIRLTHDGLFNLDVTWRPDGKALMFGRNRPSGGYDLFTVRADGGGEPAPLFHSSQTLFSVSSSRDGKWLIWATERSTPMNGDPRARFDIFGIRPGIESAPRPLMVTPFIDSQPRLSPDDRWLAYTNNESGRNEVYVVPFPNTGAARWTISSAGASEPLWSHRGNELFFRDGSGDVFAVKISTTPNFSFEKPRRLFAAPFASFSQWGYDVSSDDQRFLMIHKLAASRPDTLIVIENWFEELKVKGH